MSNKNTNYKKLALLGLAGGLMLSPQAEARSIQLDSDKLLASCSKCTRKRNPMSTNAKRYTAHGVKDSSLSKAIAFADDEQLSEDELLNQLDSQGKAIYESMDEEGRALARKLANQKCAGQNSCKGLNSCKSDKNSCAGKGSCKGQGSCKFHDKNLAVKVAKKHMQKMREKMQNQRFDGMQKKTNGMHRASCAGPGGCGGK